MWVLRACDRSSDDDAIRAGVDSFPRRANARLLVVIGARRTDAGGADLERPGRVADRIREADGFVDDGNIERNDDRVLVHPSIFTCPLISSSDAMPCASQKSARARAIVSVAVGS